MICGLSVLSPCVCWSSVRFGCDPTFKGEASRVYRFGLAVRSFGWQAPDDVGSIPRYGSVLFLFVLLQKLWFMDSLSELRSCLKVEAAALGSSSLIVFNMMSMDVMQHSAEHCLIVTSFLHR